MSWEKTAKILSGIGIFIVIKMTLLTPYENSAGLFVLWCGIVTILCGLSIDLFIYFKNKK